MTKDLAESFGLPKQQRCIDQLRRKDGPADKAGLLPSDIVLKVQLVASYQFWWIWFAGGRNQAGKQVTLQVWRNKSIKDVVVTVGETPEQVVMPARGAVRLAVMLAISPVWLFLPGWITAA